MTVAELNKVCEWLIKNVFRNQDLMFDDTVRGNDNEIDLLSVIASLFNLLYLESTGEEYNYFFHWANKVGGCVDENMFDNIIEREGEREKMKECYKCGFNDEDYGCTCPHSDKWYACPIENKKPENVKAMEEYVEWLSRSEGGLENDKRKSNNESGILAD